MATLVGKIVHFTGSGLCRAAIVVEDRGAGIVDLRVFGGRLDGHRDETVTNITQQMTAWGWHWPDDCREVQQR